MIERRQVVNGVENRSTTPDVGTRTRDADVASR